MSETAQQPLPPTLAPTTTRSEWLAALRLDQRERWRRGERVLVEDYVRREPSLAADGDGILDLVLTEYLLREDQGEQPQPDEYLQRFPGQAASIQRQFALHQALKKGSSLGPPAPSVPPPVTQPFPLGPDVIGLTTMPQVAGYELLSELGRGGMGVVYKARQVKLNRVVALKMVLSGAHAGPEDRVRFLNEAEAIAKLQHPNIVQIYEIGESDGRPYFSLEFIAGGNLADQLTGKPKPPRMSAHLIETLAQAVHYAHQRGIIHRDLKPGNILLQRSGQCKDNEEDIALQLPHNPPCIPKITDFGLAKRLDSAVGPTQTGDIIGTPQYMAPEQAAGRTREVGPTTDIYALGAMLYDLLTGRPPFQGDTMLDILDQVRSSDPLPPSGLNHKVPRDLETICLKCLEKEPAKRYTSAAALADDLHRYLVGEPIKARPTPMWRRGVKWGRRRPVLATVLASGLVGVIALFAIGLWVHQRTERALEQSQERLVRLHVVSGREYLDRGDLYGSLVWFARALELDAADPVRAEVHQRRLAAVLRQCPPLRQIFFHDGAVRRAALSPDGRWLATASEDHTARIWVLATGQPLCGPLSHHAAVRHVAFSPDGRQVVTTSDDGTATLWNARTGEQQTPLAGHNDRVTFAAYSGDGRQIVTVCEDKAARTFDTSTGRLLSEVRHAGPVTWAAFIAEGKQVLTASRDRTVRRWDAATGQELPYELRHPAAVVWAALSPDGHRLATACADGSGRIWDTGTGQPVGSLLEHQRPLLNVTFSPDGRLVATTSEDDTARVWETETGKFVTLALRHGSDVKSAAFSPDSRQVVTTSDDNSVVVWDVATSRPTTPPMPHNGAVWKALFSADGRLITVSDDNAARVWDLAARKPTLAVVTHEDAVNRVVFSPDGRLMATASDDLTARVWNAANGKAVTKPLQHGGSVQDVAFSTDNRFVVTASADFTAQVWDVATGEPVGAALYHEGQVYEATFSPDGRQVATASADRTARLWDAATGRQLRVFPHNQEVLQVAFSPDGRRLVTASYEHRARIWDAETGQELTPGGMPHGCFVTDVAYSPDGRILATASNDQLARTWDAATGQLIAAPLRHASQVRHVAFSPNNLQLLTAGLDNTARIWDLGTGQLAVPPLRHRGNVTEAWFSADGRFVVTASADETGRVWDAQTGAPLTPSLRHARPGRVMSAAFRPDGKAVATASEDGTVLIWDLSLLPDGPRTPAEFVALAQMLAAERIDATGGFVPLDGMMLREAWQKRP